MMEDIRLVRILLMVVVVVVVRTMMMPSQSDATRSAGKVVVSATMTIRLHAKMQMQAVGVPSVVNYAHGLRVPLEAKAAAAGVNMVVMVVEVVRRHYTKRYNLSDGIAFVIASEPFCV